MFVIKFTLIGFSFLAIASARLLESHTSQEQSDTWELVKIEPLSNEEAQAKPRALWPPICQEVLINELASKPVLPESEVVLVPQDIPGIVISPGRSLSESCIASNGGGITTFLREAYELLPHDRLNAIKVQYANDVEVQKFANFINSENFRNQLKALSKTNAYVVFRGYACHILYLNFEELLQFESAVFDFGGFKNRRTKNQAHVGIQGFLLDIANALPVDEFLALLNKKMETDEYLRKAYEKMKSREFVGIFKAVKDQPEFIALINSMRENGFKLDVMVDYAKKIAQTDYKGSFLYEF